MFNANLLGARLGVSRVVPAMKTFVTISLLQFYYPITGRLISQNASWGVTSDTNKPLGLIFKMWAVLLF